MYLYDFNSVKFIGICFMVQNTIYQDECSMCAWRENPCILLLCKEKVLYMVVRTYWLIALFGSSSPL